MSMDRDLEVKLSGTLKKRAGRMSRWANRYFTLDGNRLEYKLTQDATEIRSTFDLAPGCQVTDIVVEGQGMRARKLYTFWIMWPHKKREREREREHEPDSTDVADLSDGDEEGGDAGGAASALDPVESREKGLKQILEDQQQVVSRQKKNVQKQIDRHQAHDHTVGLVPKVAAVGLAGLLIGVLTAGIGIVPFLAVVGGVAVAGGSTAALTYRRPLDSRLILASDSNEGAKTWKQAIERSIAAVEKRRGPRMPSAVNAKLVSALTKLRPNGNGTDFDRWRRCKSLENGVSILELVQPPEGFSCRCAHVVVPTPPLDAFLGLMETPQWPGRGGSFRVLQVIDNNTDILCIRLRSDCSAKGGRRDVVRTLYLSRFWKMTDEGCFFITLNGISVNDINRGRNDGGAIRLDDEADYPGGQDAESKAAAAGAAGAGASRNPVQIPRTLDMSHTQPLFDAVLAIAPRKDHAEFDNDLPVALISCSIQVSEEVWEPGEMETATAAFIEANLVDLKNFLVLNKFGAASSAVESGQGPSGRVASPTKPTLKSPGGVGSKGGGGGGGGSNVDASTEKGADGSHPTRGSTEEKSARGAANEGVGQKTGARPQNAAVKDKERRLGLGLGAGYAYSPNKLGPLDDRRPIFSHTPAKGESVTYTAKDSGGSSGKTGLRDKTSSSSGGGGAASSREREKEKEKKRERTSSFSVSRSSEVNNEAALLRGQIAAKEYEHHRLQKVAFSRHEPASQEATLLLAHQANELTALKSDYRTLTGSAYEHVSNGARGDTTRRLGNSPSIASMHSASTASGSKLLLQNIKEEGTGTGTGTGGSRSQSLSQREKEAMAAEAAVPRNPLPPHWLPTKMERAEWGSTDSQSSGAIRSDLSVIVFSLLCLVVALLFGNLLSTI